VDQEKSRPLITTIHSPESVDRIHSTKQPSQENLLLPPSGAEINDGKHDIWFKKESIKKSNHPQKTKNLKNLVDFALYPKRTGCRTYFGLN
jgi:hypothetical protein